MNNIRDLRKQIMALVYQGILSLSAGQSCLLCTAPSQALCCPDCGQALPRFPHAPDLLCFRCAHPLQNNVCPACRTQPLQLHHTISPFFFDFPLSHLIHIFKYTGRFELADWFAAQLTPCIHRWHADSPIDAVIAMPLHHARQSQRGYNQSHEIARRIAQQIGAPCLTQHSQRLFATRPQVELRMVERRALPNHLFTCQADLDNQHILLIDDVMTTGSSLNSLAHAMYAQGARQVSAAVIARAILPN